MNSFGSDPLEKFALQVRGAGIFRDYLEDPGRGCHHQFKRDLSFFGIGLGRVADDLLRIIGVPPVRIVNAPGPQMLKSFQRIDRVFVSQVKADPSWLASLYMARWESTIYRT